METHHLNVFAIQIKMKGLIEVTASKGGKTISDTVFGDMGEKDVLFSRLMNRKKIVHKDRVFWKLTNIELIKKID